MTQISMFGYDSKKHRIHGTEGYESIGVAFEVNRELGGGVLDKRQLAHISGLQLRWKSYIKDGGLAWPVGVVLIAKII